MGVLGTIGLCYLVSGSQPFRKAVNSASTSASWTKSLSTLSLGLSPFLSGFSLAAEPSGLGFREQLEDYLKGRRGQGARAVRERLAGVREAYSFCLKQGHYDDCFGRSLAFTAAQGLARKGKGLFREDEYGWLVPSRSDNDLLLRCK